PRVSAAGHEQHDVLEPEGWGELRGVHDAQAARGARAHVNEAAAVPQTLLHALCGERELGRRVLHGADSTQVRLGYGLDDALRRPGVQARVPWVNPLGAHPSPPLTGGRSPGARARWEARHTRAPRRP